ncbi:MAG TPA: hypothetical protein PLN41_11625 [Methanothrix sp.]|jgi:hypothetical protein|nr:hypothetical protein [Methanothrix sp.]
MNTNAGIVIVLLVCVVCCATKTAAGSIAGPHLEVDIDHYSTVEVQPFVVHSDVWTYCYWYSWDGSGEPDDTCWVKTTWYRLEEPVDTALQLVVVDTVEFTQTAENFCGHCGNPDCSETFTSCCPTYGDWRSHPALAAPGIFRLKIETGNVHGTIEIADFGRGEDVEFY